MGGLGGEQSWMTKNSQRQDYDLAGGRGACEVGWEDRIENCLRGHCRGGGGFRPGTHFAIVPLLVMTKVSVEFTVRTFLKKMSFPSETSEQSISVFCLQNHLVTEVKEYSKGIRC